MHGSLEAAPDSADAHVRAVGEVVRSWAVPHWGMGNREFQYAKEHHPTAAGKLAVKAEHELVEIAGQVCRLHRTWCVPRSHPFAREMTWCTAGSGWPGSSLTG